jgi:hypothetical protein
MITVTAVKERKFFIPFEAKLTVRKKSPIPCDVCGEIIKINEQYLRCRENYREYVEGVFCLGCAIFH